MKYLNAFELVADQFRQAQIPFLLIGGFAVNYYNVSRNTADIDFLIKEEDYARGFEILKKFGYREFHRQSAFAQLKSTKSGFRDVDFIFVDENTFKSLIGAGKEAKIAGQKAIFPSLEHLIALKLHAIKNNPKLRVTKDLPDIIELIRMNRIRVKTSDFRNLCLKFGTQDVYEKILQAF